MTVRCRRSLALLALILNVLPAACKSFVLPTKPLAARMTTSRASIATAALLQRGGGGITLSTVATPVPDLIVPFGPRALLSAVGALVLMAGVWHVDRTWDEEGSKLANKGKKGADLDAAMPFPYGFFAGWALWAVANFFPAGSSVMDTTKTATKLAAAISVFMSIVASVPMANSVKNRDTKAKTKLSMGFLAGWIGLTISTIQSSASGVAAKILCPAGMVSIIASMKILWKYRKMGDMWEQDGKPNPKPVVYNLGGPLFVMGWFLYWVGMAATTNVAGWNGSGGLPIYFNARTALAMTSGCGMVPVVAALDYAHDEGSEYTGFGTDGRFFGRFLESPLPFLLAWAGFGTAALLPFGATTTRQWIMAATCLLQGVDAGLLIQTSLYKGDLAGKTKWSFPFVGLFMGLAVNIGLKSTLARALSIPGAVLCILGQKTVFGDRKRGDYWMETGKVNPNPIVYSYGEPLFMLGWILISLAMSLPFV